MTEEASHWSRLVAAIDAASEAGGKVKSQRILQRDQWRIAGFELNSLRDLYQSNDGAFAQACKDHGIDLSPQDRTDLMWWSRLTDEQRGVMGESEASNVHNLVRACRNKGVNPVQSNALNDQKAQLKKRPQKYSGYAVALDEGVLDGAPSSGTNGRFKALILERYPTLDIRDPKHEQQLRLACREIFAERNPEAAAERVEAIKESLTPTQRESFEKKFDSAVSLRAHQHIVQRVDAAIAERRADLDARERDLNGWAESLAAREADVTAYMTEQEFKLVLGCLHPDRAGDDEVLRKRLDRAFDVFRRLEPYIKKYPISVLRERGWAK